MVVKGGVVEVVVQVLDSLSGNWLIPVPGGVTSVSESCKFDAVFVTWGKDYKVYGLACQGSRSLD